MASETMNTPMSGIPTTDEMCERLVIRAPDDFHHHFRDGSAIGDVVDVIAPIFARVIAMPNTVPPIRDLADALGYRQRILSHSSPYPHFTPLMTLYLTDDTTPQQILEAKENGSVYAVKCYPAGATTNSQFGVTDILSKAEVFSAMESVGMPLLMHGEVVGDDVDVFDREAQFLEGVLRPLLQRHPNLRVVMEHITTATAAQFVRDVYEESMKTMGTFRLGATITPHHLLHNRNAIFKGGIRPHMYCLPILKRETDRQALLNAATSGLPCFFAGTDSAPHVLEKKEGAQCGCAGIYTAPIALELYAMAFEERAAMDRLESFMSEFGARFYDLPLNQHSVVLVKSTWVVPETYPLGSGFVKPLKGGENIPWKAYPTPINPP